MSVIVVVPGGMPLRFKSVAEALGENLENLRYPIYSANSVIDKTYLTSCDGDPWEYLNSVAADVVLSPPKKRKPPIFVEQPK